MSSKAEADIRQAKEMAQLARDMRAESIRQRAAARKMLQDAARIWAALK